MRKVLLFVLCLWVLSPPAANAGLVHGTIRERGAPAANRIITISCTNLSPITACTDNQGDYRVFVPCQGQCELRVTDITQPATIYSSDEPIRYDFEIRPAPDGRAVLMRP